MNWPPGPFTLCDLMKWASYNAVTLLRDCKHAEHCRQNLQLLLKHPIELHDSYSGSGTASWTMHHQYKHMLSRILSDQWLCNFVSHVTITNACHQMPSSYYTQVHFAMKSVDLVSAGVMSATACDMDNHCRKVLGSLDEDRCDEQLFLVGDDNDMAMVSDSG